MPSVIPASDLPRVAWSRETGATIDGHPIDPITADALLATAAIRQRIADLRAEVSRWEPTADPPAERTPAVTDRPTDPDLAAEVERLRADLRDLRESAIRALWDARNISTQLHRSFVRWQKPTGQLTTQADEQALAAARWQEWHARWIEVDDVLDPPGWRFR